MRLILVAFFASYSAVFICQRKRLRGLFELITSNLPV
jgi:hypothetical protein